MPITKSAKKAVRQSLKRRAKNVKDKNEIKNLLKQARNLALQKKTEEAKKLISQVYRALDKAAKKGLIKKNAASRKKSRISKFIFKSQK